MALNGRILFVDDDAASRSGYVAYLNSQGYDVVPAATGTEALTLAATCEIDVVVLDLGLPDVDGWEIARHLKSAPATADVPIIALTGADLPHERVSAMRAGCDRHLAKPCPPASVVEAIERELQGRKSASSR
jgi:CheY-like chemotaxis protein